MLQVTIKDTKTNEVIYDGEVSMVIMQAAEKNGIRAIRHKTEEASLSDVMNCVKSAVEEATEAKHLLSKVLSCAIVDDCFEEGDDDDE